MNTHQKNSAYKRKKTFPQKTQKEDMVLTGIYGDTALPVDFDADSECRGLFSSSSHLPTCGTH